MANEIFNDLTVNKSFNKILEYIKVLAEHDNKLDGLSATELSYLNNVTSNVQNQLNLKSLIATLTFTGKVTGGQFAVSSLNTALVSATATGTLGEIRITSTYIYVCVATNTWVRSALTTW